MRLAESPPAASTHRTKGIGPVWGVSLFTMLLCPGFAACLPLHEIRGIHHQWLLGPFCTSLDSAMSWCLSGLVHYAPGRVAICVPSAEMFHHIYLFGALRLTANTLRLAQQQCKFVGTVVFCQDGSEGC